MRWCYLQITEKPKSLYLEVPEKWEMPGIERIRAYASSYRKMARQIYECYEPLGRKLGYHICQKGYVHKR